MSVEIQKSALFGKISIPASKSQSLRALLFASLAEGESKISNVLDSPDIDAMKKGIDILKRGGGLIDCGNSGITYRFLAAIAALKSFPVSFTGDASLQKRPIQPLFRALEQLGAKISGSTVHGPIKGGKAQIDGVDSQYVSALLIACSLADGDTELTVFNPGELPWIDLTLDWLKRAGAEIERDGYTYYKIRGNRKFKAFTYTVPSDLSSLAFPVAASMICPSHIEIENLVWDPLQGDKQFFSILEQMGAKLDFPYLKGPQELSGIEVDMNGCIDAVPIMATLACFAKGVTIIKGVAFARMKESNRLYSISSELNKMGADVRETDDGLIIHPKILHGAKLHSYEDHRIAMSLYIAALGTKTDSELTSTECIKKTFPAFISDFKRLGRIYLMGAPFSGKTQIGIKLSQLWDVPFYDTDQLIVDKFNEPVRALHKKWGEDRFREEETKILSTFDKTGIISLGGGAKGDLKGLVVYLKVPTEVLWQRVIGEPSYLDPQDPKASFFKLIDSRRAYYEAAADITVDLGDKNLENAVKEVVERLNGK